VLKFREAGERIMKQVFISYQHDDGDFADALIQRVQEAGFPTWIDNDQLQAGTDWREGIDHAIKASCALIVIMSPAAKASEYVTYEWAFAWGAGIKVIPILYKPTPLHPRLETLHYLDFVKHSSRPWNKLIALIKEIAQESPPTSQQQVPVLSDEVQKISKLAELASIPVAKISPSGRYRHIDDNK
jgi:isopentenyl diphosphate isomerase/L-lactate dehydrogenase-like FMN-dependent dehydrogenase